MSRTLIGSLAVLVLTSGTSASWAQDAVTPPPPRPGIGVQYSTPPNGGYPLPPPPLAPEDRVAAPDVPADGTMLVVPPGPLQPWGGSTGWFLGVETQLAFP